jgi:hypothetical protein
MANSINVNHIIIIIACVLLFYDFLHLSENNNYNLYIVSTEEKIITSKRVAYSQFDSKIIRFSSYFPSRQSTYKTFK